ncbi:MAG TPA: CDP-diacylglycerol--serine O-phosphatidyltransferase [Stellaceae bacterium]|jgi:CDP-diacylglycerol--serine O-phosphatidyltransferase|nr:CDP-diacylglycerol--serine O-phosphatidyltransferase [Stellaceae bacterium]
MLRPPRMRVRVRVQPMHFSFNRMIPNILTLLALCAGMTGIRLAIVGKFEAAVIAIIVAGILDGLDGRIARLLKGTSTFGAQLDSLSDFVSFGVAPAVMLYIWTMEQFHGFGWAVVLIFAVCCGLRLARFNTQLGQELPPYAHNFFTGVPAPAGAGLVMVPMFAAFEFGDTFFRTPTLNTIVILAVACLMVSRVPTFALKRFHVPSEWVLPTLLGVGALAAFLTTEPWATLLVVGVIYVGSFPFSIRYYRRLKRTAEEMRAATLRVVSEAGAPVPPGK